MDFLTQLSGCELVTLASILSITLSEPLNTDELNILADFVTTLGDNLATIASARESNKNDCKKSNIIANYNNRNH